MRTIPLRAGLRSERTYKVRCNDEGEEQRRRWTFYEAIRFEDLGVWQKAHPFVRKVYRLTRPFPRSEIYGRSSQFRRAVNAPGQ